MKNAPRHFGHVVSVIALAASLTACSPDNGIEVTGYLDENGIELTSLDPISDSQDVQVRVIGRPGAAANTGRVIATNSRSDGHVEVDVSNTGSFALDIPARLADTIVLRHSGDPEGVVDLVVDSPADFPAVDQVFVSEPDHENRAGVEVQFTNVLADITVLVSNVHNHHVAELHVYEPEPHWHVGSIPAQSGDFLVLHVQAGDGTHTLGVEAQVP